MQPGLYRRRREAPLERSLVGFRVGPVAYAVPTECVRAIELPAELAELPHLPRGVVGVYEYRSQMLPVLDLRVCFNTPSDTRHARPKWVILESGKGLVSLVVDEVSGVFDMRHGGLEPVPPLGDARKIYHVAGVAHQGTTATFVLDLDSFHAATLAVEQSVNHSTRPAFQTLEAAVEPMTGGGHSRAAAPLGHDSWDSKPRRDPTNPEK